MSLKINNLMNMMEKEIKSNRGKTKDVGAACSMCHDLYCDEKPLEHAECYIKIYGIEGVPGVEYKGVKLGG